MGCFGSFRQKGFYHVETSCQSEADERKIWCICILPANEVMSCLFIYFYFASKHGFVCSFVILNEQNLQSTNCSLRQCNSKGLDVHYSVTNRSRGKHEMDPKERQREESICSCLRLNSGRSVNASMWGEAERGREENREGNQTREGYSQHHLTGERLISTAGVGG